MNAPSCRAASVSAPASGQGKTTITAALARQARMAGDRVRVFKIGPDFLDPGILAHASGAPVYQLDLFMGGESHCRALLAKAAREVDLILVEGVMGLFDGDPSSADLARLFGLPILLVIDGSAMAQTFGAVAYGLAEFHPGLRIAGVIANRVGGERHARMLLDSLPPHLPGLGWLPREEDGSLPERHLGVFAAGEVGDLEARVAHLSGALKSDPLALPPIAFDHDPEDAMPRLLAGRKIAIARDAAFSFIYPANLDVLGELGADHEFFSPLHDHALPACDAVWLPGGYPELHAPSLAANHRLRDDLHAHHRAGKPILAECGGMMAVFDEIVQADGTRQPGFGLLPGSTRMHPHLVGIGFQAVDLPEGSLRGHSFHYSTCESPLGPIAIATNPNAGPTREVVYRSGRLTAGYIHFYFPSNPIAVAALFSR